MYGQIKNIIESNIDIHKEDKEEQFVECRLCVKDLSYKLAELFDKSLKEELQKFVVKYYPCFNREQQRECAYMLSTTREQLEDLFCYSITNDSEDFF